MELSNFDDIRPFVGSETSAAIHRLCANPAFCQVMKAFPFIDLAEVERKADSYNSPLEFQLDWEKPLLESHFANITHELSYSGMENVTTFGELYLTNHRDIVVDPASINIPFFRERNNTCEIAIGDNLFAQPWIKDIVRLSRSFTVRRNISRGEMMSSFAHLSAYISFTITELNNSVWMAQREGRSKDSSDLTQESLIKMLALSGDSTFIENLKSLNIHPSTISYEFDPCDYLKAIEFQQRRDNPDFHKGPDDDVISMKTGILGHHGRIHVHYGPSINTQLDEIASQNLNRKQQTEVVCHLVDRVIHSNYVIYPINEWAFAELNGIAKQDSASEEYLRGQFAKINIPNQDNDFLWHKLLEMYANPLQNKLNTNQ